MSGLSLADVVPAKTEPVENEEVAPLNPIPTPYTPHPIPCTLHPGRQAEHGKAPWRWPLPHALDLGLRV